MKKSIQTVIFVLFVLTGLSLLLYPTVSDYITSLSYKRVISDYSRTVSQLDSDEYEAILSAAKEYNANLGVTGFVPFNIPEERFERYKTLLDITGTGIMGYIEIPSVNISLPIYHGADENILQSGIGHLEWSSLPVGGESSHSVLSGHTGLPSTKLFTDIDKLTAGDIFTIKILNESFTYEVDQILTVLPAEVSSLRIEKGMDYCTLITCTPYGINTHRLLVRGHRIAAASEDTSDWQGIADSAGAEIISPFVIAAILEIPILLMAVVLLIKYYRRRNKKL